MRCSLVQEKKTIMKAFFHGVYHRDAPVSSRNRFALEIRALQRSSVVKREPRTF